MQTVAHLFFLVMVAAPVGPAYAAIAPQPREEPAKQAAKAPAPKPAPVERIERKGIEPLSRVGNILLGGQPSREALAGLATDGTRVVVDLRRAEEGRGYDEQVVAKEIGLEYLRFGFGGPDPLSDPIFANVRERLAAHRMDGKGDLLLHCASSVRVGAVWLTSRVLDEKVEWNVALEEAHAVGLDSKSLEEAAWRYVLGGGNQALGKQALELREEFPKVARISVDDLTTRMQQGRAPLLLDVREFDEFAVSQLHGARNARTLDEALAAIGSDRDREVVVYCSVGYRSAKLAQSLADRGVKSVKNLEGSIFAWANSGHPVYRGTQPTNRVHPYDEKWGRMLTRSLWADSAK